MTWIKKQLIIFPILLYLPSLLNFFSSDDWFHLRISQISSFQEFLNFFSFQNTAQSATFYRPLSTQVFFYTLQNIFGLTPWPYYLFVLLSFGFSLYLVYKLALKIFKDENKSIVVSFIYGISVSNFSRIYFLSAFQEIFLVIFSLLCLLNYKKSKIRSTIFFILALLSKETAIVIPAILLIFNFKDIKKSVLKFLPIVVISAIYLYFRFMVFGIAQGDSYIWDFSPIRAANTLLWYSLWSFGAPELLVDYIGSGFRPIPRLFTDYPFWWQTIFTLLFGTLISFAILVAKKIRKMDGVLIKSIAIFLITLSPVIFLPQHKFTLELGLPLVGFSLAIVWVLPHKNSVLKIIFLSFYIILNISMNYLTFSRHYSVNRSKISKSIVSYMNTHYSQYPEGNYFEFINDTGDYGTEWGSSKQISQTLSGSDFFKVYYKNKNIKVYYQDIEEERPKSLKPIYLSTKQFIH
ncbi:MAG TPA: hypothetical protein VLH94_00110 [Spirochaetia bacterium]|nr:hypothetical protein [Spirochaetia bacterium]